MTDEDIILFQSPKYAFLTDDERKEIVKTYCIRKHWNLDKCLNLEDIDVFITYGLINSTSDKKFFKNIGRKNIYND